MRIEVEPLADKEKFLLDWETLHPRADRNSFFLSSSWMKAWLSGARGISTIYRVEALIDGSLVLLGAVAGPSKPSFLLPRALHLHALGDPRHDAVYVEYNDYLVARDAPDSARVEATRAILEKLDADEVIFRNCRHHLEADIRKLAEPDRLRVRTVRMLPTFSIDLEGLRTLGVSYAESAPRSLRRAIEKSQRWYESYGPLTVTVTPGSGNWAPVWADFLRLHQEGWRRRGGEGAFANPEMAAFHRRLHSVAGDALELLKVSAGAETVGTLYNFRTGATIENYQSGFSYEENNQIAPGLLTHALAVQWYIDHGAKRYDLLAGDSSYKRRLGSEGEMVSTLSLERAEAWRVRLREALRAMFRRAPSPPETHQT